MCHSFLVADTQLYKRLCPYIPRSISTSRKVGKQAFKNIFSCGQLHFRPCPSIRNWWPYIQPCFFFSILFFSSFILYQSFFLHQIIASKLEIFVYISLKKKTISILGSCCMGQEDIARKMYFLKQQMDCSPTLHREKRIWLFVGARESSCLEPFCLCFLKRRNLSLSTSFDHPL